MNTNSIRPKEFSFEEWKKDLDLPGVEDMRFQIEQLMLVARQIRQIERHEIAESSRNKMVNMFVRGHIRPMKVGPVEDECNQILTCLNGALWETEKPEEDSEEFIEKVVDESRQRLAKLLRELEAEEDIPETDRSPYYDVGKLPDDIA